MVKQNSDNQAVILQEALTRFVDECLQGEKPDIDEFARKYPQCEGRLKERIQDLQEIDFLFDSLVQADENEFEDTAAPHDLVGQKLASFEVEKVIGRGGMGVVYLARDTKLDRHVAIKSMPAGLLSSSTAKTRLRHEAKLLASLNHPNIAVIYDIIEHDEGFAYLILEYVPGETLAERIARELLNLKEVLSIGKQAAEAISAAHKKGIIHRDLKPGNIKITPNGRVKVLDFGLAKTSDSEGKGSETTATQPGRVMGTPAYMSPEQARGKSMGHRTDIWSFGCIMYEMLTGQLPFEGETATDMLARIIERQPDWELLPKSTPANLRVLLNRCLEKDPSRRLGDIANASIEISETLSQSAIAQPVTMSVKLRKIVTIIGAVIIIVVFAIAVRFFPRQQSQSSSKPIQLVVLPFENLGSAEDEYFAAGISSEITARLTGISGLTVIARQSALQYKNRDKSTQQIADELGVDYVLEGTIQRERLSDGTAQVRIIPQLVKASDSSQIWAQKYDSNTAGIFQIQSDLSERVAQALDVTLLEPERQALASRPTANIEAYEYYLRGNMYIDRGCWVEDNARIAAQMYQKAVDLDPQFALAYAMLFGAHINLYWYRHDRSENRLVTAKQAVDTALRLDPDLSEAHCALGTYYYYGHLEYDKALEEYAIALKSKPNDSLLYVFTGAVRRRMGRFHEAITDFKKVYDLIPRSSLPAMLLADTYALVRDYPEAERYCDRTIALSPDLGMHYGRKIKVLLSRYGTTDKARQVMEQGLEAGAIKDKLFAFHTVLIAIFDRDYQKAQELLSDDSSQAFDIEHRYVPKALLRAQICGLMGEKELELRHYNSAREMLEAKILEEPEDPQLHSALGMAYAGLGLKEDAVREGLLATELLPISKEAWSGFFLVENLARIYAMVSEYDTAIDQIEYLLSIPGEISVPLLRLDPAWDPLRNHPRFRKLIETGN